MSAIKKTINLIAPYWKSEEKLKAWSLLLIVIVLNISSVLISVRLNTFTKDIYNALEKKSYHDFIHQLYIFIALVFILIAVICTKNIVTGFLQFNWRRWLTKVFLSKWTESNTYYHVMIKKGDVDNPDQRLSQDLKFLSFLSLDLFLDIFLNALSIISFGIILWQISSAFPLFVFGYKYTIQGYLLYIAILYASIGTYFAIKVGRPLIPIEFINEKVEADFRFSLIRLQEKREETALYDGTNTEVKYLKDAFLNIQKNFYSLLVRTFYYNIYSTFYINLDNIIPLIAVSPLYFSGAITLGIVMQVSSAFGNIMNALSIIVLKFAEIASWRASLKRLIEFNEYIDTAKNKVINSKIIIHSSNEGISINDVSLTTPENRDILYKINMHLKNRDKILLMGQSGIGKSTLIKAIAGLWVYGNGNIELPNDEVYFIPQKPYMPISTLKEAILYPVHKLKIKISDSDIIKLLKDFKMHYLYKKLNATEDWGSVLSLGEQQRISVIRALLHKPKWLVMDEPTSSLNEDLQNLSFSYLTKTLKDSGIITVGHTKNLEKFHNKVINAEQWICKRSRS